MQLDRVFASGRQDIINSGIVPDGVPGRAPSDLRAACVVKTEDWLEARAEPLGLAIEHQALVLLAGEFGGENLSGGDVAAEGRGQFAEPRAEIALGKRIDANHDEVGNSAGAGDSQGIK